ncbi:hypothetical protein [Priestia megaterium]|uniref:hypothetical protein n=1 Tax=Priestia megaterium TaxID=1404 RepID=UPI00207AC6A6|nr:hypothetical protein [Priestia megaterium]USL44095.1 hypothetical protein LIS78_08585 [Priestia megaterium]
MSLATYIGSNVELPINKELDDLVTIGSCFSDERNRLNIKKHQYSCWVGEEAEEQERKLTLNIHYFDIDDIDMREKTLVRIEK